MKERNDDFAVVDDIDDDDDDDDYDEEDDDDDNDDDNDDDDDDDIDDDDEDGGVEENNNDDFVDNYAVRSHDLNTCEGRKQVQRLGRSSHDVLSTEAISTCTLPLPCVCLWCHLQPDCARHYQRSILPSSFSNCSQPSVPPRWPSG